MSLKICSGSKAGRRRGRRVAVALALGSLVVTACGDDEAQPSIDGVPTAPAPTSSESTTNDSTSTVPASSTTAVSTTTAPEDLLDVVVTTSVLESVLAPLLVGVAKVTTLMPNGSDPHDFAPSARDAEAIDRADLVVINGLGLEEGLVDLIERRSGPTFAVTDHVALLGIGDSDGSAKETTEDHDHDHGSEEGHESQSEDEHGSEDGHDHGSEDPHVWVDPVTLEAMVADLGDELQRLSGLDLADRVAALRQELIDLDVEIREIMEAIQDCVLVTGHDSLQYFAERYGCRVIGAIIPSLSSGAEASAGELADLRALAESEGVRAIFTELGTPSRVAEQVASEVGVPLVELATHLVPEDGGYRQFMLDLASTVAGALS